MSGGFNNNNTRREIYIYIYIDKQEEYKESVKRI